MPEPVVAVALSGGVDSLVSGILVKKRFSKVFGIHFTTGFESGPLNTRELERQLGFNIHTVDLSDAFQRCVVKYMVDTYLDGRTPNPCLICNRDIKFGALFTHAMRLGATILATGHYACVRNAVTPGPANDTGPSLYTGHDALKDQTYFLSLVPPALLDQLYFPLCTMTKQDVRKFASANNLTPLHTKESQDICFLGSDSPARFIARSRSLPSEPGPIVNADQQVVGTHQGLYRYTIGQRRGINCPASRPYYVRQIDIPSNRLVVCHKEDLAQDRFEVNELVWNGPDNSRIPNVQVRIRYNHPGTPASLVRKDNIGVVTLKHPQNAVTPGQAAVFYDKDQLIGAGIIQ